MSTSIYCVISCSAATKSARGHKATIRQLVAHAATQIPIKTSGSSLHRPRLVHTATTTVPRKLFFTWSASHTRRIKHNYADSRSTNCIHWLYKCQVGLHQDVMLKSPSLIDCCLLGPPTMNRPEMGHLVDMLRFALFPVFAEHSLLQLRAAHNVSQSRRLCTLT